MTTLDHIDVDTTPQAPPRTAVLDASHAGDIEGALGRISTVVTEFIGISLAAEYLGVPKYVVVPFAAIALIAIMATGSFRRWERAMLVFIVITLLQIPMVMMSHPQWGHAAKSFVVPGVAGGITSDAVLLIIAIVGTTVA